MPDRLAEILTDATPGEPEAYVKRLVGRPPRPGGRMVVIPLRVPPDIADALRTAADRDRRTLADFCRLVLADRVAARE